MRIWSLHPRHLDRQALIAGWREALLAKAVITGQTRGYKFHPQLARFQAQTDPVLAIDVYLKGLLDEAGRRGYAFNASKVGAVSRLKPIAVESGQVEYEWLHLKRKVEARSPEWLPSLMSVASPEVHPMFKIVDGPIAEWERP